MPYKCCTSGVVRPSTKADVCNNYALEAVVASKNNTNYKCGYPGNRWSGNFKLHYDWCMAVGQSDRDRESAERAKLLKQCTKPTTAG
jgi:hypothetical protein